VTKYDVTPKYLLKGFHQVAPTLAYSALPTKLELSAKQMRERILAPPSANPRRQILAPPSANPRRQAPAPNQPSMDGQGPPVGTKHGEAPPAIQYQHYTSCRHDCGPIQNLPRQASHISLTFETTGHNHPVGIVARSMPAMWPHMESAPSPLPALNSGNISRKSSGQARWHAQDRE